MIATIDVGLKNLAICVMNCDDKKNYKTYNIQLWNVFNLLDDEQYKCKEKTKTDKICNKKALYKYTNKTDNENSLIYTCKTHFPKDITIKATNKVKSKLVKEFLLQDIATIVIEKINDILMEYNDLFINIKKILIELQPRINNKMLFVSHLIYGKFTEFYIGTPTVIRFIRASNKLKAYKGPVVTCNLKGAYAKRKYLSVEYTKWLLNEKLCDTISYEKFMEHSKKDDLGDVFLMAINDLQLN